MSEGSSRRREAFVQLMTEHQGRLYAYVLSLLGDPDQANDGLQEANLVLWRNAAEFQMGSNFRAWVFRIAHSMPLKAVGAIKPRRGGPR